MKINKEIIKELSEYLKEFNLTEIEYTDKDTKIKVSKTSGSITTQAPTQVSPVNQAATKVESKIT